MIGYGLETGAVGFAAYVVTVLALLRACRHKDPALMVTASSLAVYIVALVGSLLLGRRLFFWPFSAMYWFSTLCFLMAFGAIYKSISLRILLTLLNRPHLSDQYEVIFERSVRTESYQNRLQVLLESGWATRGPAGFQLTLRGRRIAATVHRVQRSFKIERSG